MPTPCVQPTHAHPIDDPVADRVVRYESRIVPALLWHRYSDDLKALVLAAQPASPEDAKSILGTASVFIVDATSGGRELTFDELFTEVEVAAYCTRFERDKGRTKTYANHRGRLNRLLRAKSGLPTQVRTARRDRDVPPPYTVDELRQVVDQALAAEDRAAAKAVVLGAGTGQVGGRAGDTTPLSDLGPVGAELSVALGEWVEADDRAWTRARRHADAIGVELTRRRLEVTWAASLIAGQTSSPLVEHIRRHGLTRRLLDRAHDALPDVDDSEVVAALAGL